MKARRLVVCLIIVAALISLALWYPSVTWTAVAQSQHNAAEHLLMGNPSGATTDTNNPNNYLMEKIQYVLSYSRDRGTPNWVSWHLDSSWITGAADRQNDFRPDPAVPAGWYRVQAGDYQGSGFDRGHITPSADRTSSVADNSATFLMTNFVPQSPDNNQGPWAGLEGDLRALVSEGNELYIISGPYGTGGEGSNGAASTVANGHVTVPQKTWKVVLVLPAGDNDLARVSAATRTIAVIMPNTQGIRGDSWRKYLATVDQVELLTGYDFFSNVPVNIQSAIESKPDPANNSTPVAASQSVTTPKNTPVNIVLTATDANVNSLLSYSIVSAPAHGTLSGTAPNLTYTPAANYSGPDSFTFKASDGTFDSNTATVTITVSGSGTPPASTIQLTDASYSIKEDVVVTPQGYASLIINVTRTGDTSTSATVRYATSDLSGDNECDQVTGRASQRCDYAAVAGTLRFAANDTSKTIYIPVVNDGYSEGAETFNITLDNAVGATIGRSAATITIEDDPADWTPTTPSQNPYLSNHFFVRQNYLDFLAREPDEAGWNPPNGWPSILDNCGSQKGFLGAPPECDRAHVSHGFFASPEFTDKGFLIYRMYEVGMGRLPRYAEFIPDMAAISGYGIAASIEAQNLADYLQQFSSRQEFIDRFNTVLQPSQATLLIQAFEQTSGITLPATATTKPGQPKQYGRAELIQKRASGQFTVGQTLKAFVEQQPVYDKYFPRGFVTMQYFAYLRRDPDLNDPGLAGWNEWVYVFINGGASRGRPDILPRDYHHLIFGFIYSLEYRKRFGAP